MDNHDFPDPQHMSSTGPLQYPLYIHNCVATQASNTVVNLGYGTAVVGLIHRDDKTAYTEGYHFT